MIAAQAAGGSLGDDIPGFGLTRCSLEFLMGMLCLAGASTGSASPRHGLSHAAILLAAGLILSYVMLPIGDALVMPAVFALLVFGLADPASPSWTLAELELARDGRADLLLTYLSHFFIRAWVKLVLVRPGISEWIPLLVYLVLVALASVVLYRMVEVPESPLAPRRRQATRPADQLVRRSKNDRRAA